MGNPQDLSNKILFLDPTESGRLAAWLSQLERVPAINLGRWHSLCLGSDYIGHRELAHLMDCAPPVGFAMQIIRGTCEVTALGVEVVIRGVAGVEVP